MLGNEVTMRHAQLPCGSYAQTHEEHSNDLNHCTRGAINMGPTGNQQGGHWFFCLSFGSRILRHCWTELPPAEVCQRVNAIGLSQRIPTCLTYANRYGHKIQDNLNKLSDDGSTDSTS